MCLVRGANVCKKLLIALHSTRRLWVVALALWGMRITVSLVLSLVANGLTAMEILSEYPDLEAEDIRASLLYAAFLANEEMRSFVGMSA